MKININIDFHCLHLGEYLLVKGWVYDPEKKADKIILYLNGKEFTRIGLEGPKVTKIERADVSQHFGSAVKHHDHGFFLIHRFTNKLKNTDALSIAFGDADLKTTVEDLPFNKDFKPMLKDIETLPTLVKKPIVYRLFEIPGLEIFQSFDFKNAVENKTDVFVKFHLDHIVGVPGGVLLSGWYVDLNQSIEGIYLMNKKGEMLSANFLPNFELSERKDVQKHVQDIFQVSADLKLGFLVYAEYSKDAIKENDKGKEKDKDKLKTGLEIIKVHPSKEPIDIVFFSKDLETIHQALVIPQTSNEIIEKTQTIFNFAVIGHPRLYEIYDKHLGPAVKSLAEKRKKPNMDRMVKHFSGAPIKNPEYSLIIPLYGRYDFISYQLANFCNDPDFKKTEIIYVVDDPKIYQGVIAHSKSICEIFQIPFTIVYCGANLGYAGANNFGASFASGNTLVLLNSDIIPKHKGWISTLGKQLKTQPKAGIVGPRLLYEDGSIQHAAMKFDQKNFLEGFWINLHPGKGLPPKLADTDNIRQVEAVTGACMFITAELYKELGGLDEGYILGDFEDSDLCLKVYTKGYKIYYVPTVELFHLERQSQSLFSNNDWKTKLTIFNGWQHTKRWDDTIKKLKAELSANQ